MSTVSSTPSRKRKRTRTLSLENRDEIAILSNKVDKNMQLIAILPQFMYQQHKILFSLREQMQVVSWALRDLIPTQKPDVACA